MKNNLPHKISVLKHYILVVIGLFFLVSCQQTTDEAALSAQAAPAFVMSLTPNSLSVIQGQMASATLGVTSGKTGYSGAATLSLQGAPAGVNFSPTSITVVKNSTVTYPFTLTASTATPPGTYTLTIVATGTGKKTSATGFTLTVLPPPGSLDSSFDDDGIVTTDFRIPIDANTRVDTAQDVAVQSDGKIVVAGDTYVFFDGDYNFAVARYNSNGSLDTSFASTGKVIVDIGSSNDRAHAVVVQSDGKIVVAGESGSSTDAQSFTLVRFAPGGALDSTFGTNGVVVTDVAGGLDSVQALALQSDGKIVAAGWTYSDPDNDGNFEHDFALVRYTTNGSLDTSFAGTGKVVVDLGTASDVARSVALQNDGKIVAGGDSNGDFALVRYNPNGSLDSSFAGDGTIVNDLGTYNDVITDLAFQNDGKIVVGGITAPDGFDLTLARYTTDGSPDASFGGGGVAVTNLGSRNDVIGGVVIQADGKIIVGGYSNFGGTGNIAFALARYTSGGTLDTTFGSSGTVTTPISSGDAFGLSLARQADGKVVLAGYTYGNTYDFALARYNP